MAHTVGAGPSAQLIDGNGVVLDDFREAYTWLKHNSEQDARVLARLVCGHLPRPPWCGALDCKS